MTTDQANMNDEQKHIAHVANNLLATLDAVVPSTTAHYAVEDARQSLRVLARVAGTIRTAEPHTWTFCGHWENDRIVVDYALPGEVQDDRNDEAGKYPEGLWAVSASGTTIEEARAAAIAEYERNEDADDD